MKRAGRCPSPFPPSLAKRAGGSDPYLPARGLGRRRRRAETIPLVRHREPCSAVPGRTPSTGGPQAGRRVVHHSAGLNLASAESGDAPDGGGADGDMIRFVRYRRLALGFVGMFGMPGTAPASTGRRCNPCCGGGVATRRACRLATPSRWLRPTRSRQALTRGIPLVGSWDMVGAGAGCGQWMLDVRSNGSRPGTR